MLRFEYEGQIEAKHRFTCFGTDLHRDDEVIAFVNEAARWIAERGEGIRHHKYAVLIPSDELALEFRLRWC